MVEIEKLKKEYQILEEKLLRPDFLLDKEYKRTASRFKKLKKLIELFKKREKIKKEIEEAMEILKKEKDPSLKELAKEELKNLSFEASILDKELKKSFKKEEDFLVEIRAGAGGEEAALWARDLFLMYQRFAQKKGWKTEILDSSPTSIGGLKKIFFSVKGEDVKDRLKYESGVHRVQRVPKTEKSGRIHTSTATVAVLKIPEKKDIEIRPEDLKIETFRSSGPGGQYVNKRETAVRITHLPTNITVTSQEGRTQFQNRKNAISILKAILYQKKEQEEKEKVKEERESKIKRGMRAEKIRTYNFPQGRVTDHRLKKSWRNLQEVLEGKLDPIIEELKRKNLT